MDYRSEDSTARGEERAPPTLSRPMLVRPHGRRPARLVLMQGRDRFELLFDSIHAGIALIGLDGKITDANRRLCALLQHGVEEVRGRRLSDFACPSEMDLLEESRERLLAGEIDVVAREQRWFRKLGTVEIWVNVRLSLARSDSGVPLHFVAAIADVTARRHAAERASRLMRQHALILDSVSDGVMGLDLRGHVTFVNKNAVALTGYRNSELLGRDVHRVLHHPYVDSHRGGELRCRLQAALVASEPQRIEHDVFWTRKSKPLAVACEVHPLRDEEQHDLGRVLTFRDITERQRAERVVQEIVAELGRNNREMEEFIYSASHDLKSPLVTIQGFLGHLVRDVKAGRHDRLADFSDRVQSAVSQMHERIDNLLELSRIGRVVQPTERIDVNELVRELIELYEGQLRDAGIEVVVQSGLPAMYADRLRLSQVFDNLLANAIKHGCGGPAPCIRISSELTDREVRFCVADNGAGVPVEYHERIFGLFQRVRLETPGSGVGLAIVKRVVDHNNGRVWIESRPDKGAAFWFAFPIEMIRPPEVPVETEACHGDSHGQPTGSFSAD